MRAPSERVVDRFRDRLDAAWQPMSSAVLTSIARHSGLTWGESDILVYTVCWGRMFSDPLTVRYHRSIHQALFELTHELIHRNTAYTRARERHDRSWKWVDRRYREESHSTRIHVVVHAVLAAVGEECYGHAQVRADMRRCERFPDYHRAWEIVLEEGTERILSQFRAAGRCR